MTSLGIETDTCNEKNTRHEYRRHDMIPRLDAQYVTLYGSSTRRWRPS
jgi:hypothetical protein